MRHLNYNHLLYFWSAVREGGIAAAARSLHITPQTISGQIKLLERAAGGPLLEKKGRKVAATELGLTVFEHASEIFARGEVLQRLLQDSDFTSRRTVTIGISDVVPNLVAWRLLAPLMQIEQPYHVVCHGGALDSLATELAQHRLDLVVASSALSTSAGVRAFSHLLGECDISFFAPPALAARLRRNFPESMDEAPFLLPSPRSPNRRVFDAWFAQHGIRPRVIGEFDDSSLLKTFGKGQFGVFAAPSIIEEEVTRQCGVRVIGKATTAVAKFYALTTERRIRHPAVVELMERARTGLFADQRN